MGIWGTSLTMLNNSFSHRTPWGTLALCHFVEKNICRAPLVPFVDNYCFKIITYLGEHISYSPKLVTTSILNIHQVVPNSCFRIITYLDVTPSILFFCIAETTTALKRCADMGAWMMYNGGRCYIMKLWDGGRPLVNQ